MSKQFPFNSEMEEEDYAVTDQLGRPARLEGLPISAVKILPDRFRF